MKRDIPAINRAIGARIRLARENAEVPQRKLAALLDVSCQQISKYENGSNCVSAADLKTIAAYFKLAPDWFLNVKNT